MTLRDRIEAAAKRRGQHISQVAGMLGLTASSFLRSVNEDSPTYKRIPDIAKVLEVPEDWLRNGGVPPWKQPSIIPAESVLSPYLAKKAASAEHVMAEVSTEILNEQCRLASRSVKRSIVFAAYLVQALRQCKSKGIDLGMDEVLKEATDYINSMEQ